MTRRGEEPVRPHSPEVCEYCGKPIPPDELAIHKEGLDRKRMACSHQDLDEIADMWEPKTWTNGGGLPDAW